MKKTSGLLLVLVIVISLSLFKVRGIEEPIEAHTKKDYWFVLNRKSNTEYLYFGEIGSEKNSALVKVFKVKAGIPGKRPTPLPELFGREYWEIIDKFESQDNPETAPYFLTLDIPGSGVWPYGPTPYLECNGQCDWVLPGKFGLHGVNGDNVRLSEEDSGSSGCIRHADQDISYIYNLIDPAKSPVRYYINDI